MHVPVALACPHRRTQQEEQKEGGATEEGALERGEKDTHRGKHRESNDERAGGGNTRVAPCGKTIEIRTECLPMQ